MKYQLTGDFLRVISYFFASLVMAQARVKLMLGMEILSATVYLSSIAILVPIFGVEGICMSHVVRYVIYTSTLYGIYRYHFVVNSK
jgi:PST family polysaccharide transporter